MYVRVTILLLAFGLTGCGQQSADVVKSATASISGLETGKISAVRILPENPRSDTPLKAEVLFQGNKTDRLRYQWLRDGVPIAGARDRTLPSGKLHRGDFISVRVWLKQPGGEKDQRESEVVLIGNSLPVIKKVSIEPNFPTSGDALEATVASKDWDEDEVSFTCEWLVNGEAVIGAEDTSLASNHFRRGDEVQVVVTPYDRDDAGETRLSPVVVVRNGAPRIVSDPPELSESDVYRYEVRTEDPDGDAIQFSLSGQPPAGMEIEPDTGVVIWPVTVPEQEITYIFEVVAEDPEGAKSIQNITMISTPTGGQASEG
jgi:hypothetical protein